MRTVVFLYNLFAFPEGIVRRFAEHLAGKRADGGVVNVERRAGDDPPQPALPHGSCRLGREVAARIDVTGRPRPNQLELTGERGPVGILLHQLLFIAVQALQEMDGNVAFVRKTTAELLGVVYVRIHQTGHDQLAPRVDLPIGLEAFGNLVRLSNGGDPVILDGHRPILEDPPIGVHGDQPVRVLDQNRAHAFASRPVNGIDRFRFPESMNVSDRLRSIPMV